MANFRKDKLIKSIDRAIALIATPAKYGDYISVKIAPVKGGCCCFHCWPYTWSTVNRYLLDTTSQIDAVGFKKYCHSNRKFLYEEPLNDEGDVVVGNSESRFVLECHESGPEIIIYLGFLTAITVLLKSVIDLINTIIKALHMEESKRPGKVILSTRIIKNDEYTEEQIMEVELPLTEDLHNELEKRLMTLLKKERTQPINPHGPQ